jgi:hypothetical protein
MNYDMVSYTGIYRPVSSTDTDTIQKETKKEELNEREDG